MPTVSRHLDDIIDRENHIAALQVAFADIEKYSQRRTQSQAAVIAAFTRILAGALEQVASRYAGYAGKADINISTDVIRLPTGDGAAIVFPFQGVPDFHLTFARQIISAVSEHNESNPCERFETDGWCNCHDNFRLRVGLAEGRGVVFKDLNGNYNAAGTVLNTAARIMGLVDGQQVAVSDDAFKQLVDLVDDPAIGDRFRAYDSVSIKHGHRITFYQYLGDENDGIDPSEPRGLVLVRDARDAIESLTTMVPVFGALDVLSGEEPELALTRLAAMVKAMTVATQLEPDEGDAKEHPR
jgi:class 3 adenylate cyclase